MCIRDSGGGAVALTNQTEDFSNNLCGWLVHDEGLLIVRLPLVAIRDLSLIHI